MKKGGKNEKKVLTDGSHGPGAYGFTCLGSSAAD